MKKLLVTLTILVVLVGVVLGTALAYSRPSFRMYMGKVDGFTVTVYDETRVPGPDNSLRARLQRSVDRRFKGAMMLRKDALEVHVNFQPSSWKSVKDISSFEFENPGHYTYRSSDPASSFPIGTQEVKEVKEMAKRVLPSVMTPAHECKNPQLEDRGWSYDCPGFGRVGP